jgi:hypothetical protein
VLECLNLVLLEYHAQHSLPALKILRSDQEGALSSDAAAEWFKTRKVQYIASPTDVPELNGIAEEVNADQVCASIQNSERIYVGA